MNNLPDDWNLVLELTQKMLHAAQNSEWEKLTELESERYKLIFHRIFSPPSYRPVPNLSQIIQQLQNIDQQIIALCQEGQQVLANQIKALRIGQRARQAYNCDL